MRLVVLCLWWGALVLVRSETCSKTPEGDAQWARLQPMGQCEGEDACPYQLILPPLSVQLPRDFRELERMSRELRLLKEEVSQLRRCCLGSSRTGERQQQPGAAAGEEEGRTSVDSTDAEEHTQTTGDAQRGTGALTPHGDELNTFTNEQKHNISRELEPSPMTTVGRAEDSRIRTPPVEEASTGHKTGQRETMPHTKVKDITAWTPYKVKGGLKVVKVSELTPRRVATDEITKPAAHADKMPRELNPVTITRVIEQVGDISKEKKGTHHTPRVTDTVLTKTHTNVTLHRKKSLANSDSERITSSRPIIQNEEIGNTDVKEHKLPVSLEDIRSNNAKEDLIPRTLMSLNGSSELEKPEEISVGRTNRDETELQIINPLTLVDGVKDLDPKPHQQQIKTITDMKKSTLINTHLSGNTNKEKRLNIHAGKNITKTINQITANVSSLKYSEGEQINPLTTDTETNPVTKDREENIKTSNPNPVTTDRQTSPVPTYRKENIKTTNPLTNNKHVDAGKSVNPVNKDRGKNSLNPNGRLRNTTLSERIKEENTMSKDLNLPNKKKVDLNPGQFTVISNVNIPKESDSVPLESTDTNRGLKSTQAPIKRSENVVEQRGLLTNPDVSNTQVDDREKKVKETLNKAWNLDQKTVILGDTKFSDKESKQVLDRNENVTQLPDLDTPSLGWKEYDTFGKKINSNPLGSDMSGSLSGEVNTDAGGIETVPGDIKQIDSVDRRNDSDTLHRALKPLNQIFHNNQKQLENNNTSRLSKTKMPEPITQDRPVDGVKAGLKPLLSIKTEEISNTSSVDNISKPNILNTSISQTVGKSVGIGTRTGKVIPEVKVTSGEKQVIPVFTDNKRTGIKQTELDPVTVPIAQKTDGVKQPITHRDDNINNTKGQRKPHHPVGDKAEGGTRDKASDPVTMDTGGGKQSTSPPADRDKGDSHPMSREQPRETKSKNAHRINLLKPKGQSDSIKSQKEKLKPPRMDDLSEENIQSTAENVTAHLSVEGTDVTVSVIKSKNPSSVDDLKSSLKKQPHYRKNNRTDDVKVTNVSMTQKSNVSMTQGNNTSGLKKLLPPSLNKNQTKQRQPNILKKEPVVSTSRKKKPDPVPGGKVTKRGESHVIPGRKNNSQLMDLKPPAYIEVAKYTDEVRGSKSLTVEGISSEEPHPIPPMPKSNRGTAKPAQDCSDYTAREPRKNGIFIVRPDLRNSSFPVFCEMEAYGGGWTLLQRRYDGSISFNRSWNEYKRGFGHLDGEFWLGNDMIHLLTKGKEMTLRIQLQDLEGLQAYATYEHFSVASEHEHYRLTVGQYDGTAGDALNFSQRFNHDQKLFTTYDRDNDQYLSGNCGAYYGSGWWFDSCMSANLNGKYYHSRYKGVRNGIYWGSWPNISREYYPTNYRHAFKTVSMMIRPKSYKP